MYKLARFFVNCPIIFYPDNNLRFVLSLPGHSTGKQLNIIRVFANKGSELIQNSMTDVIGKQMFHKE
ncbi:MAG: hypothetical protein H6Q18_103 [Bacteroidetes bacterium]|nr:hypothetical protein [Bacteroidota bacterium]